MVKLLARLAIGAVLGLGMGVAATFYGWALEPLYGPRNVEIYHRTVGLLERPFNRLIDLDSEMHLGILDQNPINTVIALACYWALLGEILLMIVLVLRRVLRSGQRSPERGAFPVSSEEQGRVD